MKTIEFIAERKKKTSKSRTLRKYFYPGYGYYGLPHSETGSIEGSDTGGESINKDGPAVELAKKLPSLKKHDYDTIDRLMKKIASRHKITGQALHDLFIKKYRSTPDDYIKNKLDEEIDVHCDMKEEVEKFTEWVSKKLKIKDVPKIMLSSDTKEAQDEHHTGRYIMGSDKIWVYAKNRNLVDILRTIAHELTHMRQDELGKIGPNDSYPGSPIEMEADAIAGALIKIYGEKNHHIFQ